MVKRSCQGTWKLFPFIFFNLSGFSTLLVATCLLRGLFTQDFNFNSPTRGYLSPGNTIVLGIPATLFIIHQRHNFLPILALILLKLKHASNWPVYFPDLCAAYALLTHVRKFVMLEKYTTWQNSTKHGNLTKIFSSESIIETNNIFAIRGKKPFPFQLRAHNRCHKACAIK